MPRYSRYETLGDGDNVYDDRYDAGEFDTYGESTSRGRGPSSGEFYDDRATSRHSRHPYDTQGYSREGAYGGEESLRHRLGREGRESYGHLDESRYNGLDPRTRVGRDDLSRSGYASGHRSGLSQQIHTDNYEEHRQTQREREQSQIGRQLQAEHEREARRAARYTSSSSYASQVDNPYARSSRDGSRRSVGTTATDPYLAYSEALRAAEQETEYDSGTPRGRGIGRWQYR